MSVLKGEGDTLILYGTIDVPVGARTLSGYLARPDLTGEWPTVMIVPSAWGVTSSVKDICRRLARHGLAAIAPDPYRGDAPDRTVPVEVAAKAFAAIGSERLMADLEGVAEFLANPAGFWSNAEDGFGLLGNGDGAAVAAGAASRLSGVRSLTVVGAPLSAVDGFPLPADLMSAMGAVEVPVLGVFGKADQRFDADRFSALREAAPQAEFALYENASGDFWDDWLDAYDDAAFRDLLGRIGGFFHRTLPSRR